MIKINSKVKIPTSILGLNGKEIGTVTAIWQDGNKIAVDFDGHLGHYTVSKHEIEVIENG